MKTLQVETGKHHMVHAVVDDFFLFWYYSAQTSGALFCFEDACCCFAMISGGLDGVVGHGHGKRVPARDVRGEDD